MKQKIAFCISLLLIVTSFNVMSQVRFQRSISLLAGQSIKQTVDHGYILVANNYNVVTTSGNVLSSSVLLTKLDSAGSFLWTNAFEAKDLNQVYCVEETNDKGYIFSGFTASNISNIYSAYIVKSDSMGNLIWSKIFNTPNENIAYCVKQTIDGGYALSGTTNTGPFIIKTDANGDTIWTKQYGSSGYLDGRYAIEQTKDSGYILVGTRADSIHYSLMDVIKTDVNGDTIWTRSYGATYRLIGRSIHQTDDGGYVLFGYGGSSFTGNWSLYLLKIDSIGNLKWSKTLACHGGDTYGWEVHETTDHNYFWEGMGCDSTFHYKTYILKTDTSGNLLWSREYGGANYVYSYSGVQTDDGGYCLTGQGDVGLIKTDSNGVSGCQEGVPNLLVGPGNIITLNETNVISRPTFIVSSPSTLATPFLGVYDSVICLSVNVNYINYVHSISVFPNPTSGVFTIESSQLFKNADIVILNSIGEIVFSRRRSQFTNEVIDLSFVSDGLYTIKIISDDNLYISKIIIYR